MRFISIADDAGIMQRLVGERRMEILLNIKMTFISA